ncbi:cilia- and flagella-associated protein 251 isoform X1 [Bombyx mori]|uniref:Cilia- and flagella-associated protein 251 n=1 Tax=Bombyx mori TaxID=7091 RepID=A0A8R2DN22_BOMMO|nr:cilia- and flagella-associated protein 251 isoform X1 [Bombyx mori]
MESKAIGKVMSLPNIRDSPAELGRGRLYSMSLSQIKKYSESSVEFQHKLSPFNLRWIHGYNPKVGVINLNNNGSTSMFYAASNCGVIYNWTVNQMRILQGHRHMISCISSDRQGKWLVTADSGPENVIIIWDSVDYFPQRTIFSPHGKTKISKVVMSADAKYLLSLGYSEKTTLNWWDWSSGLDDPDATLDIDIPRDGVIDMAFNSNDSEQFLLLTKHNIWIGVPRKVFVMERGVLKETDKYELKIKKIETKTGLDTGKLTCFTFVEDTSQILVATTRGTVLVYGYKIEYIEHAGKEDYENLKFIKMLKVEKRTINVIKSIDGVITTGNSVGEIHFYDNQMKLMYWVHRFTVDSVKGLSFNVSPRSYQVFDPKCNTPCPCWEKVVAEIDSNTGLLKQKLIKKKLPSDATVSGKTFLVRDFIVCTNNQGVGFVDFATEKLVTVLNSKRSYALALSVHPEKPYVCIGYDNGIVEMYNFVQHKLFVRLDLRDLYKIVIPPKDDSIKCNYEVTVPPISVSCLKYSHSGMHLACGLNTGQLLFLHPTTIDVITEIPYTDTGHAIKQITYSCDSLTLALFDAGRTVCVYKYDCQDLSWKFIGKHRAHYKDITSILFLSEKNANGEYKLISLGIDRIMVEYDIGESADGYLEILSLDRLDQTAVPLAGIQWPSPEGLDPDVHRLDLPLILVANDEFKYKIVNYATTMTLSTILGPRYEHPVRRMLLTAREEDNGKQQYLIFATKNVVGIQKMPIDGNPWKHAGLLGHPLEVTEMCFREDCGILFTIGDKDGCMSQWAINYRSVDTTTKQGGGDLDPYYCLIENGRPGWLFQEIRDLFYYIQILCQGTFSPAMRRVKDFIPIDSLPDLMRALGFFLSEYETENLIAEAKYKVYQINPSTEIDFEEFVKLYINHRPAFGYRYKKIRDAFAHFAYLDNEQLAINRNGLIELLADYGERFPRELTWYLISILCGESFEDRAKMAENDFSFMPEELTLDYLATYVIGVDDLENIPEGSSGLGSFDTQSAQTSTTGD